MKCPICARETDSDAVFCEICGKKIPRCPSCGKVLYERSRFCDHDGAPLPEELFLDLPPDPSDAPPPQKKRSGAPLIAVLILLAVLLLAAGAGGYVLLGGELPFLSGEQPEEENRLEEAKAQLDEALALFPENAELRGKLARVEELMEQANRVPPISMDAVTAVDATSYLIQSSYSLYHTPDRMMDGDLSTAWVEGASGDGIGESVTFTFDGTYPVSRSTRAIRSPTRCMRKTPVRRTSP